MNGLFITFEGIEGCGKTTQIQRLAAALEAQDRDVLVTREPGGTPAAEAIRNVLLDPAHALLSTMAELLLYTAARAQHLEERILPALEAEKIVLCDRFLDSTLAYQGGGRGLDAALIRQLHALTAAGVTPDATFLLDLPAQAGLDRALKRAAADRIEQEPIAFHECVRQEFLRLAAEDPRRITIIDAARPVGEIATHILAQVNALN